MQRFGFLARPHLAFILTSHAPRLLRSSASAHRVFAARWRGANEGADEESGGIQDAGGGDHRSRESFWRDRILSGGDEGGNQTDYWLRGICRARIAQRSARVAARRRLPFYFAGEGCDRLSQSGEVAYARACRRLSLVAQHSTRPSAA